MLEELVSTKAEVSSYYAWLRDRYKSYFKSANGDQINKFIVRYYRAKKLVYSSAQMFAEAQCVKSQSCIVAYYYLSYYALFQAMQANLLICTVYSDEKVLMLSHDNVKTYFDQEFCKNGKCPMNGDIIALLEDLRKFREYYSYAMPFNLANEAIIDDAVVEKKIKVCCQLLNFTLFVIYKEVVESLALDVSQLKSLKEYMHKSCNRLNDLDVFHDAADANFWNDLIRGQGADIIPISFSYDHDFDEYAGYDSDVYQKMNMVRGDIQFQALRFLYSVI
jgi:hypothetical protein